MKASKTELDARLRVWEYHAILIKYRDPLRFIGLDDIHKGNPKEVVYRFCRVVFGVTSSPFRLNITIKKHLQKYANGNLVLVKALLISLYVDDMTSGESTVERGTHASELSESPVWFRGPE